jgi:site-specific recombinase XerD
MTVQQLPLFPGDEPQVVRPRAAPGLDAKSRLSAATERFRQHMVEQEFAENTVKSFLFDLGILARYLKSDPAIGQIATPDLERFLHWLQHERGKPCSPKSYARRLTTLKVFFGWLADVGVLPADPAAALVHKPASAPLPRILDDEQVEQVLAVTQRLLIADKADARPHLLVTLLLHTGIKKQECMALKLADIHTGDAEGPSIRIRYDRPRMEYKERRLRLPPGWARTLGQYRRQYEPQEFLFPCTARNLEYVLAEVAQMAGLEGGLSFEMLRWTCAVRDHKARMDPDRLRRKLGLSQMSWQETEPKLVRLAEPPL